MAALRAGAETAGVPVYNCVLIAGSQSGVAAAERVGMPCVVLRSRLIIVFSILDSFYWVHQLQNFHIMNISQFSEW